MINIFYVFIIRNNIIFAKKFMLRFLYFKKKYNNSKCSIQMKPSTDDGNDIILQF